METDGGLEKVIEQSPVLGDILREHGHQSVFDYLSICESTPSVISSDRKQPLLDAVAKAIGGMLTPTERQAAITQLSTRYVVSTAEHHGPMTHPFSVGPNLARSLIMQAQNQSFVFVLACGGISMSNSSFPRGLILHNDTGEEQRLHFIPWRERRTSVLACPSYNLSKISELNTEVENLEGLVEQKRDTLKKVLHDVYTDAATLEAPTYSRQITLSNRALWQKIPGLSNIQLLCLQQEDVVTAVLLDYHLKQDTFITRLLTSALYLDAFEKYFNGIRGAFSDHASGTFLFWYVNAGKREALFRTDNTLSNHDGSYTLTLDTSSLTRALETGEIFPSLSLMFIVCSMYHGLTTMGGFLQVSYLGDIKVAYSHMLDEVAASADEYESLRGLTTDCLSGDFLYTYSVSGGREYPTTALDLILNADEHTTSKISTVAHQCTLREALEQMAPELHKIFFGTLSERPAFSHTLI